MALAIGLRGQDRRLDFLLDVIQVEGRGCLHWWVVDRRFAELGYHVLDQNEAPCLATEALEIMRLRVLALLRGDSARVVLFGAPLGRPPRPSPFLNPYSANFGLARDILSISRIFYTYEATTHCN